MHFSIPTYLSSEGQAVYKDLRKLALSYGVDPVGMSCAVTAAGNSIMGGFPEDIFVSTMRLSFELARLEAGAQHSPARSSTAIAIADRVPDSRRYLVTESSMKVIRLGHKHGPEALSEACAAFCAENAFHDGDSPDAFERLATLAHSIAAGGIARNAPACA
jgi:hypothetical protein